MAKKRAKNDWKSNKIRLKIYYPRLFTVIVVIKVVLIYSGLKHPSER